jgi:beta-galactosidase
MLSFTMKRRIIRILILLCLPLTSVFAQRESKTINDGWRFFKGDSPQFVASNFEDLVGEKISLPHTWNTDAYTVKDYYKGKGWYHKHLQLPESWKNKQIFLKFEAASKSALVYMNDQLVGEHRGGYTAFSFDITPYYSFSSNSNYLAVCVDNARQDIPPISGDFTFFGGIYRDVWVTAVPKQHFNLINHGSDAVFIQTPSVSEKEATMTIHGEIKNDANDKKRVNIEHHIYSPSGGTIRKLKKTVVLKPNELHLFKHDIPAIEQPVLWSPETPELYLVETVLSNKETGEILDKVSNYTGFRWYRFDANEGFFLNGKPYKLRGVCRHQDQKPYGVALSDEAHRRDMLLIKEMGANFIRISHYPQDAAILEQCDKLGVLAWEEIPVIDIVPDTEGYADACEQNLREMIRQHYNHPSIITWGYMNEILLVTLRKYRTEEELQPVIARTLELTKRLEGVVKEEDPYRVSAIAFHGSNKYNETGLSEITGVIGWNLYSGWYGGEFSGFDHFLDEQHRKHPTHPVIVSEYGAGSDKRIHSLEPKSFDFSIEYQQRYLEHYLPAMEERPFVSGGAHWNFIDFSSALRDESMPRINNKGLVYADRTPKDVFYYFKALFRKDIPVVHVASRDWTRRAGVQVGDNPVMQPVKIYTNLPEVELYMDGVSLGKKKSSNCLVSYDVPFVAGQHLLRAVGILDGGKIEDGVRVQFTAIPSAFDRNNVNGVELGINAGSKCFFESEESDFVWLPDQPYQKGSWGYITSGESSQNMAQSTQVEIRNTMNGPLFQTMRVDPAGYRFDVPDGVYEVELLFADMFRPVDKLAYQLAGEKEDIAVQENVFHININGNRTEEAFSPGRDAGYFHAVRKRFVVPADGNGIEVRFEKEKGKSFLSGIKLRKLI